MPRATTAPDTSEGTPSPDASTAAIRDAEAWAAAAHEARRRLEALDAATVAISQELSLERVLQIIVDSVRPLAGARYAALGIPDEHGSMERFITSGLSEQRRAAIGHPPRGLGLLGVSLREGETVRIDDIGADPRSVGFPADHPSMTTFLSVPVKVEGRSIGNLYLSDRLDGQPFSEDDGWLVESFARHAGLAIHNARMHEELRQLAVLQERERIAQDLHDGSIQSLYAVSLALEDTEELMSLDPAQATDRIDHAIEAIHGTIQEIRDFIMGLEIV
jgi:GAF domain-containing protein